MSETQIPNSDIKSGTGTQSKYVLTNRL